jgi:hypothetical protein
VGIGGDGNPLAVLLTQAKVAPASLEDCLARVEELRCSYGSAVRESAPPEIAMLFDERCTLPQLMHLKRGLVGATRTDRFLLASLAGILHGNHPKDPAKARTLSISMPNTFSMAPGYLARYIREHGLKTNPVDAFDLLERRVRYLFRDAPPSTYGRAELRDARDAAEWITSESVSLIVTSPPYLHVIRYGKFNWIRLWLLGECAEATERRLSVERTDVRLRLSDRLRLPAYREFMRTTITSLESVMKPGATAVFVIGDVTKDGTSINLANEVWRSVRSSVALKLVDVVEDQINVDTKVTRIWGSRRGNATCVDRLLILRKPGAKRPRTRRPEAVVGELLSGSAR